MSDAWETVGEESKKCVVGTTVHEIDGRAMNFTRLQAINITDRTGHKRAG